MIPQGLKLENLKSVEHGILVKYPQDPVTGVSTYTDPQDGVVYELDPIKNAW